MATYRTQRTSSRDEPRAGTMLGRYAKVWIAVSTQRQAAIGPHGPYPTLDESTTAGPKWGRLRRTSSNLSVTVRKVYGMHTRSHQAHTDRMGPGDNHAARLGALSR